jgi:hypothetical protein
MGIANIINTSTSSGGGGGEIIRELVNSSDGQGLYFSNTGYIHLANNAAVEFGTSDFSIEFVMNQTGEVGSSGGSIYQSATTVNNKFSIENHVSSNVVKLIFFNAVGAAAQYDLSYNMAADYNEPTHYVVSCDRSGNAVLYRNGTEVASVSIAASASTNLGDGVTSTAMIGNSGSGYTFLGGLYRFRTWNKALSHDEVDTCFQRADVPFADQYGSETDLVTNGTFTGGTTGWNLTSVTYGTNNVVWAAAGGWAYIRQASWNITVGKKYRITYDISGHSANGVLQLWDYGGANTIATLPEITGNGTFTHEFEALKSSSSGVILGKVGSTFVGTMDNVSCVAIGVLTDHDLAFANPTQSAMCQDRAGNSDGTMGGTIQQTQPIVQLNSTSARIGTTAATPADGEVIANVLKAASDSSHATIEVDAGSNSSNSDANFNLSGTRKGIIRYDHNASDASGKFQIFSGGNTSTARVVIDGAGVVSTTGHVAINHSSPNTQLDIKSTPLTVGASGLTKDNCRQLGLLITPGGTGSNTNGDIYSGLALGDGFAGMYGYDGGSGSATGLGIFTGNGTTVKERIRITDGGQVTVGIDADPSQTASPSMLVTAATAPSDVNGYSQLVLQRTDGHYNADGAQIMFNQGYHSGNTDYPAPVAAIRGYRTGPADAYGGGIKLCYQPNNAALGVAAGLTLDGNGLCTFSNGIAFSQTNTSATGASATHIGLDHYEEGTWTPRIAGNTSGVKTAGSTNAGKYTRIGNLVTVTGTVSINGSETIAGEVKLTGLPFSSVNTTNYRSAGIIGANSGAVTATSGYTHLRFVVDPNAAHAWIVQVAADNSGYSHTPAVSSAANVALLGIQITYECA